jgi:hypothetical protein
MKLGVGSQPPTDKKKQGQRRKEAAGIWRKEHGLMNRKMLYPLPESEEEGGGPSTKLRSNSYEPFRMLDTRIEEGLRGMAEEEQQRLESDPKGVNGGSQLYLIRSSR